MKVKSSTLKEINVWFFFKNYGGVGLIYMNVMNNCTGIFRVHEWFYK